MNHVLDYYQFVNESEGADLGDVELIFDKGGKSVERAHLSLRGNPSAQMTKLINEYVRTHDAYKEAEEEYEKVKKNLKDSINQKFDIQHQFITRTVETVKYLITFSKYVQEKRGDVVDYKAVVEQLLLVFPEIREGLEEITKACTETNKLISPGRSGSIKHSHIKMNEGVASSIKGMLSKIKGIFSDLTDSLKRREKRISTRLERIKKMMKM